jgi:hypothetical protein
MGLSGHDHHAKYIGHETHFQTVIKMCYFKIINTYSYLPALYNLEANMLLENILASKLYRAGR